MSFAKVVSSAVSPAVCVCNFLSLFGCPTVNNSWMLTVGVPNVWCSRVKELAKKLE